ncbi:aldo/keto reductase, partial [bacterium]|nr:aldo/keto reductase [bacterium]
EGYFSVLKSKGIDIFVRSVFLQGLVFLAPQELCGSLVTAKKYVERLREIAQESRMSIVQICMDFVLNNSQVTAAVIGVDSLEQFTQNIKQLSSIDKFDGLRQRMTELEIGDENILLPYKWSLS